MPETTRDQVINDAYTAAEIDSHANTPRDMWWYFLTSDEIKSVYKTEMMARVPEQDCVGALFNYRVYRARTPQQSGRQCDAHLVRWQNDFYDDCGPVHPRRPTDE